MSARWTRAVLRHRTAVLACWLAVLVAGPVAAGRLTPLLATSFSIPGTESEQARVILGRAFDERPDGTFTVVVRARRSPSLRRRLDQAAHAVPSGHAGTLRQSGGLSWAEIATALDVQHAKRYTPALRRALAGGARTYVTGPPAIQHDLDPILAADLRRGEAIALPVALAVLVAVLGFSLAVLVPFLVAGGTIGAALLVVYGLAHAVLMVSYVTNLVVLVGVGLAVDYSLLVVTRFREELTRAESAEDAIVATMATAGRTAIFSAATVAIGLAVLLFMPVPFVRSLGIGGFLVPIAAIGATATLQPALLSLLGSRAGRSRSADVEDGFWARLGRAIMRRPKRVLVLTATALAALATPAVFLHVTPGSLAALPRSPESVRGLELLRGAIGVGAISPTEIVADAGRSGGARTPAMRRATRRLAHTLAHDREVLLVAIGRRAPYVDPTGRYARVIEIGR